jgi:hypothetical protein
VSSISIGPLDTSLPGLAGNDVFQEALLKKFLTQGSVDRFGGGSGGGPGGGPVLLVVAEGGAFFSFTAPGLPLEVWPC